MIQDHPMIATLVSNARAAGNDIFDAVRVNDGVADRQSGAIVLVMTHAPDATARYHTDYVRDDAPTKHEMRYTFGYDRSAAEADFAFRVARGY